MTSPEDAVAATPGTIVPLLGAQHCATTDADGLVERIRRIRAAGAVPLVGDGRWSDAFRDRLARRAANTPTPLGTAWATLTSGSTGDPRVVCRSAHSWSASFPAVAALLGCRHGDAIALPAPPASSLSLFSIAHALEGGPLPVFGAGRAIASGDFADATLFHGTPHALGLLLDAGAPARLRTALVGGSALDATLRARAAAQGIRVVSYYGAAELSFVAVDHGDGLVPFPGVELDVRGGVLWVRSPFVAAGYLGQEPVQGALDGPDGPDPVDEPGGRHAPGGHAARGPWRSEAGWHTVGDRARWESGRLRLLGRSDGAILTASATVVPEEIEAVLRSLPGVGDAVVLGLPNRGVGALLAAVIEPGAQGAAPAAARLRRAATEALAPAHRPRRWFSAELPRTASGKPARAELARRLAAGEVRALG